MNTIFKYITYTVAALILIAVIGMGGLWASHKILLWWNEYSMPDIYAADAIANNRGQTTVF